MPPRHPLVVEGPGTCPPMPNHHWFRCSLGPGAAMGVEEEGWDALAFGSGRWLPEEDRQGLAVASWANVHEHSRSTGALLEASWAMSSTPGAGRGRSRELSLWLSPGQAAPEHSIGVFHRKRGKRDERRRHEEEEDVRKPAASPPAHTARIREPRV